MYNITYPDDLGHSAAGRQQEVAQRYAAKEHPAGGHNRNAAHIPARPDLHRHAVTPS